MGIEVRPRSDATVATYPAPSRYLRMVIERRPGYYGATEGLGYSISGDGIAAADSARVPGPTLVLQRGERTQITVVNRLPVPTSVHWHGIELESFYDGVAGWSGARSQTSPLLASGDSFVVRITPPRAGTFMYHTHVDELAQFAQGQYGTLLVLERGQRYDPTRDHVLMLGAADFGDSVSLLLNGRHVPARLGLTPGVEQRLRLVSMVPQALAEVELLAGDSTPLQWRAVAKDGADLPSAQATPRPARLHIAPGEAYDFTLVPPPSGVVLRFRRSAARQAEIVLVEPPASR
jgi:FtsP/CotA-like multicopper oxidase with cupredoxin domain